MTPSPETLTPQQFANIVVFIRLQLHYVVEQLRNEFLLSLPLKQL